MIKIKIIAVLTILLTTLNVNALEDCKWDNRNGLPCVTITKTPNTSSINGQSVSKKIFTKQDILVSGEIGRAHV